MRRTLPPVLAALALALLMFGTHAAAQRRPHTRPCPRVVPDGQICTAWGRATVCRYGAGTSCICQRRSARDRAPRWYCGG